MKTYKFRRETTEKERDFPCCDSFSLFCLLPQRRTNDKKRRKSFSQPNINFTKERVDLEQILSVELIKHETKTNFIIFFAFPPNGKPETKKIFPAALHGRKAENKCGKSQFF
jgi:hypothetical protein